MTERDELRVKVKMLREKTSMLQVLEASARIGERVLAMDEYRAAKTVFCYYSLPMEVQTGGLIREMLRQGKEVYLPVTGKDRSMKAVRLRKADAVHRGAFKVMEPDGDEEIDPAGLDLILTPGLAFDRAGGRIGYGAGCFDRFLPRCRGLIVGLALDMQLVDEVPMEVHDVYMHRIITQSGVIDCGRGQSKEMEVKEQ